ncbi:MAG: hypothetical protein ACRDY7_15765, partial [Acidimicrobiia bacterium]
MSPSPAHASAPGEHGAERRSLWFWVGLAVGWAAIAYGLGALFTNTGDTNPQRWWRWFVAGAVTHDALVAPLVCGGGWALTRLVPRFARGAVAGGLIVSGAVIVFAWPFLRGYGELAGNPSALPRNYAGGVAGTLALVWVACAALAGAPEGCEVDVESLQEGGRY